VGSSNLALEASRVTFLAIPVGWWEGRVVGGAAQVGKVAEIVGELPGEHAVEFAFDQK